MVGNVFLPLSFLTLFLCFSLHFSGGDAHSKYYYEMIDDIMGGINYYELLEVSNDANSSEIRRKGRQIAMKYHPDRNKEKDAPEMYQRVVQARDVLTDDEARAEYDDFLVNGIPWHEEYYGKYAHKWGAPEHDIRWVAFWLIFFLTVSKYAFQWYHYHNMRRRAMQTPKFKHLLKSKIWELERQNKSTANAEDQIPIEVVGAEKPIWQDIFVVQLIVFPYDPIGRYLFYFGRWLIWYKLLGKGPSEEEAEEEKREELGLSESEWAAYKRKMQTQEEYMRTSGKMKRIRRFMKNRSPQYFGGED
eukprot:TRINITY_DN3320_c0_g1_i1.p1 TRINITY_DN3320_c0_g1~~TRINITY_DN3320_c0_g1_i1.p1  ORF type:complete len:303 (-),score=53.81 TRINITY_DN3320_c0_g1_i1:169-1077(-)